VKLYNARRNTDNVLIEGFLSNGPLYTLLAMYMPLSALAAMFFLAQAILPVQLPLSAIIISACVSAVIASLYCDFMKDVKSSLIAADIRGAVIIMGGFYALVSVFRREIPIEERFRPDIANILSAIGALYTWYSVVSLKQLFSARRHFEIYTELYREEQLQKVLLEDSSLLHYTNEIITKRKRNYITQLVLIGILTLTGVLLKAPMSLSLYLLLIGILAGGIYICGFFEIMRWEQYYAGEGIALSAADRLKRTVGMGIFILFCITCAILAASDTSLLPFSAITFFFAWLFFLFNRLFFPSAVIFAPDSVDTLELTPLLEIQNENAQGLFPKWLIQYGTMVLKYGLIVLAAAGFVMFMISPLLERRKHSAGNLKFHERLMRIIAEWFKGMLTVLSSFYAFLKNGKSSRKLKKRGEEIRRTAATILNVYSQAKKQNMRRSVTLFARLIIWGGEVCHVDWKPSYAPGEYCGILAVSAAVSAKDAPENSHDGGSSIKYLSGGIIRCGELFEQALYSADVLSDAEQQEFKNTVEEITSTTA